MSGASPAVLFGLRCGNPHHPKSGEVYGINPEWQHLARLTNDGCSELVVSSDGGVTWAAAPRGGAYLTRASDVTVEPAPCYTNGGCNASLNCVWPKCRPWDDMDADEVLAAAKQMSGQIAEALGQRDEARAEAEQLSYERRLLGACRRHLDEIADPEGRYTVEAVKAAGDLAQRIVDEIGHSVTDEPALGPSFREEIHRLRAELEQVRAELQRAQPVLDAGRAWWASKENAPEDPTVDALFAAVDTYVSAADSMDGMPEPCQPIGCDNGHHLVGCVYAAADAGEDSR